MKKFRIKSMRHTSLPDLDMTMSKVYEAESATQAKELWLADNAKIKNFLAAIMPGRTDLLATLDFVMLSCDEVFE